MHASLSAPGCTPAGRQLGAGLAAGLVAAAFWWPRPAACQDLPAPAPSAGIDAEAASPEPFGWGDFTWLNGASRQRRRLLAAGALTGQVDVDLNYNFSFRRPIDDTVVGSTALARHNELQLTFLGLGGDLRHGGVRARLFLQHGTRSTVVPRNDASAGRGQYALADVYRFVSEAWAGYHWDVLSGINLDVGLFNSYIGLFSYDNFENWAYQPSYTSDNTPWFFNGLRLQIHPNPRVKTEVWLVNGWQSYGKFNAWPSLGGQVAWRPSAALATVFNAYVGTDTLLMPGRIRLHSDNSVLWRYYSRPAARLSGGAVSVTLDVGGETGDGVSLAGTATTPAQNFVAAMAYHRLTLRQNTVGWTVGGGFIHNPGRYLVLAPAGVAGRSFSLSPGDSFDAWDVSTTLDWMPNELITWRLELVHRRSAQRYFAGRGGVTAADGLVADAPQDEVGAWAPDLVPHETRVILALMLRF